MPRQTALPILALLCLCSGAGADAATFPVTVFTDTKPNAVSSPAGAGDGTGAAGDLRNTIRLANTTGGTNTITFVCPTAPSTPCKITLSAPLPPITSNLTIDGGTFGNIVIDGNKAYRVFFADTGTILLANLQIQNGNATGGAGGTGYHGGGGGAGLGAGLFVNQAGANVTVRNTYFLNCSVTGGDGGAGLPETVYASAGGGGGGGLAFPGGNSTSTGAAGGGGVLGPGSNNNFAFIPGLGYDGAAGGNGGGGGGQGNGGPDGAGGAGYGTNAGGQTGNVFGNAGGFGGGGGGSAGNDAGNGGFGAGGGGGGGYGGLGGFGGGGGGSDAGQPYTTWGGRGGVSGPGFAGGGGGSGFGPAIFVAYGSLTLQNSTGSTFAASAGHGVNLGMDGTSDSTPVYNYGGTVNGAAAAGGVPGPVPGALPAPPLPATHFSVTGPASVIVGNSANLTVTALDGNNAVATGYNGTVHFTGSDGSAMLPADMTLTNGTATPAFTLNTLGSQSITATDTITSSITGTAYITVIPRTPQSITFSPAVTSYALSAGTFTVSATASSSLAVSFASTTGSVCTISGATVTLLTPGTCTIQATQAGNSTYAAATPVPVNFAISPSSQTITFNPTVTSYSLSAGTFTVSASATSSLAVSFASLTTAICTVSGSTVTMIAGGTCTIQATQAGNSNYAAATPVSVNFTVTTLTTQTITFSPAVTSYPLSAGSFTVSATASSSLTVSFASTAGSVCTISGTTVTLLTPGTCTIQATQAGNSTYAAATPVSVNFAISPSSQTITFNPTVTSYSLLAGTFTVSASATSSLAVSFASLTTAICTVSGSTVTLLTPGTCTIQATQAGNSTYSAATPVSVNFAIGLASQTITFGALPTHTYNDMFTLSATATSGLPVTFSAVSGPCSVSGTTVTVTGAGICTIAANQAGNGTYSAAPTVTQAFSGNKAVLTVTANNATSVQGSALPVFTATITGFLNGDTSAVVSGAPGLTTTATSSSPAGSYPIVASAGTLSAANYAFNPVNGTLTITAPAPSFLVNPTALTLQYVQGTSAGLTQAFTVFSSLGGTPFTVGSSAAWLVAPPSGMTGSAYSVSVNPAGLAAGSYQAMLTFTSGSNLIQVPVSLTVMPAPVLSLSSTAIGLTGTYGTTTPSTQAVQLTSTSANVPFTAAGSAPWLTVTASGTTPATLQISANPAGLGSAVYQGVVTVTATGASNSPLTIPVRFAVTGGASGILNAASGTPATATPDTLLTVPLPAGCGSNPQVTVNGIPAIVISATSSLLEFAVPEGIGTGSTATVQLLCSGSPVETANLPEAYTEPAILTSGAGSSQGSIVNSDGTVNAASNPAAAGSTISVYMTGCGALNPPDSNGLQTVMYAVAATIGGLRATVTFAGQAPGEPFGVQQVNIAVPANAPTGPNVPILVTVGGLTSPAGVTVAIQ